MAVSTMSAAAVCALLCLSLASSADAVSIYNFTLRMTGECASEPDLKCDVKGGTQLMNSQVSDDGTVVFDVRGGFIGTYAAMEMNLKVNEKTGTFSDSGALNFGVFTNRTEIKYKTESGIFVQDVDLPGGTVFSAAANITGGTNAFKGYEGVLTYTGYRNRAEEQGITLFVTVVTNKPA
eukprot:m.479862 g.479862  ORF g.479862 m.479862 type:complete len:179 (+) comp21619_c0_seq1:118-654(+)